LIVVTEKEKCKLKGIELLENILRISSVLCYPKYKSILIINVKLVF
tara:strand:- start:204 stop:341 length:138 start_codon:yes stop_codon:yes gene_type:complete